MTKKNRKSGRVTPKGTQPVGQRTPLGNLSARAAELREQVAKSRETAAAAEVVGTAGGAAVSITMRGDGSVVDVAIKPEAVDSDDLSLLEDLVKAAISDANAKATELRAEAAESEVGEGIDLAALGLDGLLG